MDVIIIGAGIGGPTLGLALHRAGFPCHIYEAVPTIACRRSSITSRTMPKRAHDFRIGRHPGISRRQARSAAAPTEEAEVRGAAMAVQADGGLGPMAGQNKIRDPDGVSVTFLQWNEPRSEDA
jgi:flavin-dependent dehydrogenase